MQKTAAPPELKGMTPNVVSDRYSGQDWVRTAVQVPTEMALAVHVNRRELVTILCTPTRLNSLVLGFLFAEGIISGLDEVTGMRICEEESLADVTLGDSNYEPPARRILTSGCGGGATFKIQGQRFDSDLVVSPKDVLSLMKQLQKRMVLYRRCGGVHTSALADADGLLVVAEDIGRHNTFDKIQGECLLRKLSTEGRILLSTGRVSSEMLLKAARMKTPIVVSRHSPTGSAVSLARELGIALVGHARGGSLSVYSHPGRLGLKAHERNAPG